LQGSIRRSWGRYRIVMESGVTEPLVDGGYI
jgi:hypothetical protein